MRASSTHLKKVEGFSEAKRRRRDEELDAFASQVPAGWAGRVAAMDRKARAARPVCCLPRL